MTMHEKASTGGLLSHTSRLAATLLDILHTRTSLLGLELIEERQRFIWLLLIGGLALILFFVGLLTAMSLLLFLFWAQRVWLAGLLTVLFFGGALLLARMAVKRSLHDTHPFQASVEELTEDVRRLKETLGRDHD